MRGFDLDSYDFGELLSASPQTGAINSAQDPRAGLANLPGAVHDFGMVYIGIHMFDNCDLEALGQAAAERNRWEFLLMAAPLPIRGGTGSPLNPIAVF